MRFGSLLILAVICTSASAAQAGRFNRTQSVGDAAPAWAGLQGTDGKSHSLKDYGDARLIVEVITCNYCPCAGL